MSTNSGRPEPRRIRPGQVIEALSCGLRTFRRAAPLCVAFSGSFAILGIGIISLLSAAGLAPMGLPLIGGFLLIAPALLAGFFGISRVLRIGHKPTWQDIAQGFRQSPRALWGLLAVCVFLFVIWVTDAGILYRAPRKTSTRPPLGKITSS
jgi:uncharacterized membrane protein